MNNYQEIITTKVLIDEYKIESDAPLVQNAKKFDLEYIKNNGKNDNAEFLWNKLLFLTLFL